MPLTTAADSHKEDTTFAPASKIAKMAVQPPPLYL